MPDTQNIESEAEKLLNPVSTGHGDQSMSFIPEKSTQAYAGILGNMMGSQAQAETNHAHEKAVEAQAYPALVNNLTNAELTTEGTVLPGFLNQVYNTTMAKPVVQLSKGRGI